MPCFVLTHLRLKDLLNKLPLNASSVQINLPACVCFGRGGGGHLLCMAPLPFSFQVRPWPQHVETQRGVQRHGHVTVHYPAGNLLQCERLRIVGYRGGQQQPSLTLPIVITTTVRSSVSTAPPLGCHPQPDPS